jgi:hypothetical protein
VKNNSNSVGYIPNSRSRSRKVVEKHGRRGSRFASSLQRGVNNEENTVSNIF